MIYIGIDPGKSGAYAIIDTCGGRDAYTYGLLNDEYIDDFVYEMQILGFKQSSCDIFVCIEKVGAMPKQGVTSTFNFGKAAGFVEGVVRANYIPYQLVPPREWKKEFGLNSDKAKSVEVCKRLFPTVNLKRTERCRKDHDGIAEALLMAEYGRRLYGRGKE